MFEGIQSSGKQGLFGPRATDLPDLPGTPAAEGARANVSKGITVMTGKGLRAGSSELAFRSALT